MADANSNLFERNWLNNFHGSSLKGVINTFEVALETMRNKKKGGAKKNKEKLNSLVSKLNHCKQIRDRVEEL